MKFEEMPYSRIDMEAVRKDFDRIDTGGDPA